MAGDRDSMAFILEEVGGGGGKDGRPAIVDMSGIEICM